MAIVINKGEKKEVGALGKLKAELAEVLESKGLPATVYCVILDKMPTPVWLKENGATLVAEGKPIIGASKGGIMYNLQGKGHLKGEDSRVGGNVFLTNMNVDEETRQAYVSAKKDQTEKFEASKLRSKGMSEEEIALALEERRLEAEETV